MAAHDLPCARLALAALAMLATGCVDDLRFDNPCDPRNDPADGACVPPPPDAEPAPACPDATVDGELCRDPPGFDDFGEESLRVEWSYAFAIGVHEVTRGEWRALIGEPPPPDDGCAGDTCPVTGVSWFDAVRFANAKTLDPAERCYAIDPESGAVVPDPPESCLGYRLPTEAEWEYVARAAWATDGERLSEAAWLGENGQGRLHPVCSAPAAADLCDLFGNAEEWAHDAWRENHGTTEGCVPDPFGGRRGSFGMATERSVRGGHYDSMQGDVSPRLRDGRSPAESDPRRGFRIARTVALSDATPCR